MPTAAILAGGQARRLGGRDKAALRLNDTSILERQLAVLQGLVDHIFIVADDAGRFEGLGVRVVPDLVAQAGALGGVYTAISAAPEDRALVIACDMPFIERALLARVLERGAQADIAVPHGIVGYQPLCASYSRACVPELKLRADTRRLGLIDFVCGRHGLLVTELRADELAAFGEEPIMFLNVNTPDDYARAREIDLMRK